MNDNVVCHPHRDLMAEAKREREIADSPEGQALQELIFKAAGAYSDFLDRHGLIGEEDRLKASALVVSVDYGYNFGTIDITLKDGACDRVYGTGMNPDPYGSGPADIPHKRRED